MAKIVHVETRADKLMQDLAGLESALSQKLNRLNGVIREHNKKGWMLKDTDLLSGQKQSRKTVEQLLARVRTNRSGFATMKDKASDVEIEQVELTYCSLRVEYMKL